MKIISEGWIAITASIIIVLSGLVIGYLTDVSLSDIGAVVIGILWGVNISYFSLGFQI